MLPFITKINENKNQSTESVEAFLIKAERASHFPCNGPEIIKARSADNRLSPDVLVW